MLEAAKTRFTYHSKFEVFRGGVIKLKHTKMNQWIKKPKILSNITILGPLITSCPNPCCSKPPLEAPSLVWAVTRPLPKLPLAQGPQNGLRRNHRVLVQHIYLTNAISDFHFQERIFGNKIWTQNFRIRYATTVALERSGSGTESHSTDHPCRKVKNFAIRPRQQPWN